MFDVGFPCSFMNFVVMTVYQAKRRNHRLKWNERSRGDLKVIEKISFCDSGYYLTITLGNNMITYVNYL